MKCLVTDNDSHWFIIDVEREHEWSAWCDLDQDSEAAWTVPEWATAVDGYHMVQFSSWSTK